MAATDHELMVRTNAGDAAALAELVRRWETPLHRIVSRMCGVQKDADDVCQEVFLRVMTASQRYRPDGAFSTWLYKIALNVVRDSARRDGRRATAALVGDELCEHVHPPVEAAARRETSEIVAEALAALDEPLREALVLKHFGQLTFAETAETLGLPESTVKSRVRSALDKLGHELRRRGVGPEETE